MCSASYLLTRTFNCAGSPRGIYNTN
uniref:Uncharacterized protein n=1 Tax=Arundo donax TaxID=35708 RepID=A0A0A9HNF6_ARUDO